VLWTPQHSDAVLTFESIARSPGESVRPDLWPDHAWVPALGKQGGRLVDVAGALNSTAVGSIAWTGTPEYLMVDVPSATYYPTPGVESEFASANAGTVIMQVRPDTVATDQRLWGTFPSIGSDRVCYIWLDVDDGGPSWAAGNWYTGGNAGLIGLSPQVGVNTTDIQTVAFVFTSDFRAIYLNGKQQDSDTPSVGNVKSPNSGECRYGAWETTGDFDGWLGPLLTFARVLAPSQIRDISADPLLPFRRRVPVFYSIPSGASFQAAWAAKHNNWIGVC